VPNFSTEVTMPFFKTVSPELGWGYILFALLVIVGASNAVNLTDGLDGLAIGPVSIAAATYMIGKGIGSSGTTINLTNCHDVAIATGASTLNMTKDEFGDILRRNAGNVFNLASNSCRVLLPAKSGAGSVVVDDAGSLTIPKAAIAEVPAAVERPAEKPQSQLFERETVELRAMDVDSRTKGWAIVVPRITNKRLKVELDPVLDANAIAYHSRVTADVELFYRVTDQGDRIYLSAYLRQVHPQ
jgi:hypothetical protein